MGSSVDILFFWVALGGFGFATLLHAVGFAAGKRLPGTAATVVVGIAAIALIAGIIARALRIGHLPVTSMFEYLSIFAWSAALFYFVFVIGFRLQVVGAFVAPVIFMLVVSASLLPKTPNEQLVPALQSVWLQIHVTLAALAEAAFGVAFAANCMYFMKKMLAPGPVVDRLPEMGRLDLISHKAIIIGYPLFTVGALFAGAIWAEQAWGSFWSWDPKEVCSLIVWLIYTIYFHVRFLRGWRGSKTAIISILGFIAALLTFFSNMFMDGLHSYA